VFLLTYFKHVRWTIIGLFAIAMTINYLTRSVLGVAAPTIMGEQGITSEQYSWITGAFQIGIMFQPVAGYVLDIAGLRYGFTFCHRSCNSPQKWALKIP
jgi:MFS transporter, ACS family, hexuronate transporter